MKYKIKKVTEQVTLTNEQLEFKKLQLVKYVLATYSFLSLLEDCKDTIFFKNEIKFHGNRLYDELSKQLNSNIFKDILNNDQELIFSIIESKEVLLDKIIRLKTEEQMALESLIESIKDNSLPKKYMKYKVKKINNG